jgi:hypothetical protein
MKRKSRTIRRSSARWYVLIHQLPPEPLYLRAKIRQRLTRVGAVALKNAVYVLPRLEDCLEDLQWIAQEAIAGAGEAFVCEAHFLEEKTEEALVAQFRSEREADYEAITDEARLWKREGGRELPSRATRARRRLQDIARIDFFEAPGRRRAEKAVQDLEAATRHSGVGSRRKPGSYSGRTWVTRRGIHIDRIASAWLIRRFIDRKPRFRFVDPKEAPRAGELRFDMVGGDFTHEGDRCTFETLVARSGLQDRALADIGEIVHDIDLKDEKFGRPEAAGIERMVTGLILANAEDAARLERGRILFDELYQSFQKRVPGVSKEVQK